MQTDRVRRTATVVGLGVVVAAVLILSSLLSKPSQPSAAPTTEPATEAAPVDYPAAPGGPSRFDGPEGAATLREILLDHFPGSVAPGYPEPDLPDHVHLADVNIMGDYDVAVQIGLRTIGAWSSNGDGPLTDPCVVKPGDSPGRQGAPRPGDVCTEHPQSDGTTVWIHGSEEPSGQVVKNVSRITNDDIRIDINILYVRPDTFTPHPDAVLVDVITDQRLG